MFFKMRSAYFVAALSTALTVAAAASAAYSVSAPKIQIHAKGPAGLSIDGESNTLEVTEDEKNLTFTTKLTSIDTKNKGRNEHMRKRFDADKFGSIVLTVPKEKADLANTKDKSRWIPGTLSFHGVTKPVSVEYKVTDKRVHATFGFDVLKHGVSEENLCFEPRTKSICAKAHVDVEVDFTVKN